MDIDIDSFRIKFSTAFSFLGLLNVNSQNNAGLLEYVPDDIGFIQTPTVQSGIGSLDSAVNTYLPQATPIASANPMQIWIDVLSLIWIAGIVVLLSYSVLSYSAGEVVGGLYGAGRVAGNNTLDDIVFGKIAAKHAIGK